MLCKCHWIVLYTVHFTAFCLGGRFFPDTVYNDCITFVMCVNNTKRCIGYLYWVLDSLAYLWCGRELDSGEA